MPSTSTPTDRSGAALAPLWASAAVLLGLVIVIAGRRAESRAVADVATVGDLVATNLRSGTDEDVVAVLDTRSEVMLVYRVENRRSVELVQGVKIPEAFAEARGLFVPGGRR